MPRGSRWTLAPSTLGSCGKQACRWTPGTGKPGTFPAPPARLTWPLPPSQALGVAARPAPRLPGWMGARRRGGTNKTTLSTRPGRPWPPTGVCPDLLAAEAGVCTRPAGSGTWLRHHLHAPPCLGAGGVRTLPGQPKCDPEQATQPLGGPFSTTGGQGLRPPLRGEGDGCALSSERHKGRAAATHSRW